MQPNSGYKCLKEYTMETPCSFGLFRIDDESMRINFTSFDYRHTKRLLRLFMLVEGENINAHIDGVQFSATIERIQYNKVQEQLHLLLVCHRQSEIENLLSLYPQGYNYGKRIK